MIWKSLGVVLLVILVVLSIQIWRGGDYGSGPRTSHTKLTAAGFEVAVVANSVAGSVTIIDVRRQAALREIDVIPDGAHVSFLRDPIQSFAQDVVEQRAGKNYVQDTDLSPDGTVLFVSRGYLGDVVAIDLRTETIMWRTQIAGVRADHMDISPDGKKLFVSALIYSGDVVEVLDTASGERLGEFTTGQWPHDVHVSEDNRWVYAASLGDMQVPVAERDQSPSAYRVVKADATDYSIVNFWEFDAGVRPFVVTEDQTRLFAQLSNTHSIIEMDLEIGEQLGRLDLPIDEGVTEADWDFEAPHHGLAITEDEQLFCVAGRASDYAAVVQVDGLTLTGLVDVGNAPSWSAISANGRHCFLANNRSDDVSIIDLHTLQELARLPVGRAPKHITIGFLDPSVTADW